MAIYGNPIHQNSSHPSSLFAHVLRISTFNLRDFSVEIRARSKDPTSTSCTPGTPSVVEPLVDKDNARTEQRQLATDHATKV